MNGRVTACRVHGLDVVISVDVGVALGRWGVGTARRNRASWSGRGIYDLRITLGIS